MSRQTATIQERPLKPAARPTAQHKSRQVALGLREVVSGLVPGDRLPSIAHLERHFGVSTGTVETAIRVLREEGLLVARRGSGVFVAGGSGASAAGVETPARTDTLAVVAPANVDYFRYFVETLTEQASRRGRKVVCHYISGNRDHEQWVADALHLEVLAPSGFLVLSHGLSMVAVALRKRGHRTVILGTLPMDEALPEGVPCIYGDQEQGAFLAIEHLLNLGHRNIGCTSHVIYSRRFLGAQRAVRHVLGDSVNPSDILRPVLLNWNANPQARDENLRDWERDMQGEDAPTALFVWNDSHALEIVHVLDRFGLRAPRDLSIVAYDALPEGAYSRPPLTSVDGHVRTQVSHALDILELQTTGGHVPRIAVTPTLVVRESSAAPPRPTHI